MYKKTSFAILLIVLSLSTEEKELEKELEVSTFSYLWNSTLEE